MQEVQSIFDDIQDSASVSSKQVYNLLKIYESKQEDFFNYVTQAYLKIIKNLLKAPKETIRKFETFSEKFITIAYKQYQQNKQNEQQPVSQQTSNNKNGNKGKKNIANDDIFKMFQYFLQFFNHGLESSQFQIKIFCVKLMVYIIKPLSEDELANIDTEVAKKLLINIIGLLRDKKPMMKELGIKLSSLVQLFAFNDDLQQEVVVMKHEMIKIMCNEEKQVIRKLAVTNMDLNDDTFGYLIKRIRDKDPDIRCAVFRKLIKEQISIMRLPLADMYKLVYDGLGSSDTMVRESCIQFLQMNFKQNKDVERLFNTENNNQMEDEYINVQKRSQRFKTPKKEEAYKEIRNAIRNFLQAFEIEKTLIHSHIYEILEEMTKEIIKNVLSQEDLEMFCQYLRELLQNQLNLKKQIELQVDCCELFLLRVLCKMIYGGNQDELKEINKEIQQTIEDNFPQGIDFCKIILYYLQKKDFYIMPLYQCILLSEFLINCDQPGRNELQSVLIKICSEIKHYQVNIAENEEVYNDVFQRTTGEKSLYFQQFDQGYCESPIIITSFDLLPIVMRILRKLMEARSIEFITKVVQIISEVREPFFKEDEEEEDVLSKLTAEQGKVQKVEQQITEIEEKINQNKKIKSNIYNLEMEKDDCIDQKNQLNERIQAIESMIYILNLHSLTLAQSLLQNYRVDSEDLSIYPTIFGMMKEVIGPVMNLDSEILQGIAVKSYILFMLMSYKSAAEYAQIPLGFIAELVDETKQNYKDCKMKQLISLKGMIDYLMLYEMENDNLSDFCFKLIRIGLKSELRIKVAAVEGICKLLYNDKIKDQYLHLSLMCALLFIWLEPINQIANRAKLSQMITAFIKKYGQKSVQNLENIERALEMFVLIINNMQKDKKYFNKDLLSCNMFDLDFIIKYINICLHFLKYSENKQTLIPQGQKLGPQERFFVFICKKSTSQSDSSFYFKKLFSQGLQSYDFVENISLENINLIDDYFDNFIQDNGQNFKEINSFYKTLKKNQDVLTKDQHSDYQIDKEQLKMDQNKIDERISETESYYTNLLKFLTYYQVIVNENKEDAENRQNISDKMNQSGITEIYQQIYGKRASNQKNTNHDQYQNEDDIDEEEGKQSVQNEQIGQPTKRNTRKQKQKIDSDNNKNSDESDSNNNNNNNQSKGKGTKKGNKNKKVKRN